jgi:hypothetical protein
MNYNIDLNHFLKKPVDKKTISLLSFDDDTFCPVLTIQEKYLEEIKSIYDEAFITIDIDVTDYSVARTFNLPNVTNTIFCHGIENRLPSKIYDLYRDSYLPKLVEVCDVMGEMANAVGVDPKDYLHEVPQTQLLKGIVLPSFKSVQLKTYDYHMDPKYKVYSCITMSPTEAMEKERVQDENHSKFSSYRTSEVLNNRADTVYSSIKEGDIAAYDEFRDIDPEFASQCVDFTACAAPQSHMNTQSMLYVVVYHPINITTVVLKDPSWERLAALQEHPEYGLVEMFSIFTNEEKIVETLVDSLHCVSHSNLAELNQTLKIVAEFVDKMMTSKEPIMKGEEALVSEYLSKYYIIDTDINHKMQAAQLFDRIMESGILSIELNKMVSFRNRLSKYLKNMGLQKKRFSDGFYYYGIRLMDHTDTSAVGLTCPQYSASDSHMSFEECQHKFDEYVKMRDASIVSESNKPVPTYSLRSKPKQPTTFIEFDPITHIGTRKQASYDLRCEPKVASPLKVPTYGLRTDEPAKVNGIHPLSHPNPFS